MWIYDIAAIYTEQKIVRYTRCLFFFFNDTATTEIYTLSLHDALPIFSARENQDLGIVKQQRKPNVKLIVAPFPEQQRGSDRKSTRLNSSHANISYAVFCLKKKKKLISHSQPSELHSRQCLVFRLLLAQ